MIVITYSECFTLKHKVARLYLSPGPESHCEVGEGSIDDKKWAREWRRCPAHLLLVSRRGRGCRASVSRGAAGRQEREATNQSVMWLVYLVVRLLVACCLAAPLLTLPMKCCEQGYSLGFNDTEGFQRPICVNATPYDYDYYSELGIVDVSCLAKNLRSAPIDDDEDRWPSFVCADEFKDGDQESQLVGLYCGVTFFRCCRDGGRYDPDSRVCNGSFEDALDMVRGGDASRAQHQPVDCPGLAVVDDFAPADMLTILEDGRLQVEAEESRWELDAGTFCVEGTVLGVDHVVVRHCQNVRQACSERHCFRKCCEDGEVLDEESVDCVPSDKFKVSSVPTRYDVEGVLNLPVQHNRSFVKGFGVAFGKECAAGKYLLDPINDDPAISPENGDMLYDTSVVDVDSYCVDHIHEGSVGVMMCFPEVDRSGIPRYITVCLLISSVFLLATLVVYALLPALLNLHGKTLMCHVISLLAAYVCLSCTHLAVETLHETGWCEAVAYTMIFAFMAAFSWLNVMCFDIWWTFSTVRCLTQGSRQQREQRRFLWYNLYSWSLATFVALVTYAADAAGDKLPRYLQPLIGEDTCFYDNSTHGQKLFFELPVAILSAANMVFFVLTARNCYKVKAELQRLQSKECERGKRRFEDNKNKLITTAKLFVVMGVTWVLEFIASLCYSGSELWIPADLANALQGIFIFCIFVLKRKVLKKLGQRLRIKPCLQRRRPTDNHASPGGAGFDLWRMRKISSNSTLYTNSTTLLPSSISSNRAK